MITEILVKNEYSQQLRPSGCDGPTIISWALVAQFCSSDTHLLYVTLYLAFEIIS